MEITIASRHGNVPDPVRAYLEDKFHKLSRLHDRITAAHAVVEHDHGAFQVELATLVPGHAPFIAKADDADLRRAIDLADQKMQAQLRSWKDRLVDHRH